MSDSEASPVRSGGVQSIERIFGLLEIMADHDGVAGVSELANISGLPLPTIHRLLRTLVDLGWVRQQPSREYALGPRLIKLGDGASRLLSTWAEPHLVRLVDALGESANLAMLEGDEVVYVAQAPGRHSMRMFTEVGRRAGVNCTAVGKAMLAELPVTQVLALLRRTTFQAHTPNTLVSVPALTAELELVHQRGFAVDEQEQEIGVRCVAVAVPGSPVRAAVSISGPMTRMTDEQIRIAVPLLHQTAAALATDLDLASPPRQVG